MKKLTIIAVSFLLSFIMTLPVYALRCKNKVISNGTSVAKVKEFCPPPEYNELFTRELSSSQQMVDGAATSITVTSPIISADTLTSSTTQSEGMGVVSGTKNKLIIHGEKWFMNFGPQRLRMILTFENGVLIDEQTDSDYGS